MSSDIRELFPDDLSDETAYHLVHFFYDFALAFESMYLGKVLRYQKTIVNENHREIPCEVEENTDISDPPF